jgi:hypothetical protein
LRGSCVSGARPVTKREPLCLTANIR